MKYINTILIIFILFIVLNQQSISQSEIKSNITNKNLRNTVFNYNTQRVEPYTRIGVLYKNDSNIILSLYGRRTHVRSNTWNYYTLTEDNIKIELQIKNRQCIRKTGCKELYNGDTIHIPEYNGLFTVNMYL